MTSSFRAALLAVFAALAALVPAATAGAWAPADSASIKPGNMTFTDGGGQCTSNFVFQDAAATYIGMSAHCAGTGAATETNGCEAGSLPLGTPVEIDGASRPGSLAYSSWIEMQADGETNANACAYNDFALIKIDPADVPNVNPSVPGFGGPTGLGPSTAMLGETVYTYGNSSLRLGVSKLSPKEGRVIQSQGGGWSRIVYTATPGVPGDSGSGFMSASGQAIGTLSTLQALPFPGSNGVADLRSELDYMRAHNPAFAGVELVPGTEPFRPNLVGAIGGA